ncbi:hypothetical protein [Hymenobacter bucti]|uniref:Uncharacterized protein n=1 Tax=Hymenobacter bucti TaxID=1844114 RepID=A0ABW4QR20_9BACT
MKHLLPLAATLSWLAACQSSPTTPTAAPAGAPQQASAAPAPGKPESIEWDMLTVNGKVVKETTTKQLAQQLGRPDSIAKGAVECGAMLASLNKLDGARGDMWYYGNTMYEVNGREAVLGSFEVTTGKFQGKLGPLPLNQNTTLEDVRRVFPASAKQADVPATGQPGEVMSLPFYHQGKPTDNYLHLLFKKGRLQEVEFYSPC